MDSDEIETRSGRGSGLLLIGGGVGVFIVCSLAQAAGGSHMFTMSYEAPDNALLELLMMVTWWPGWILTVALIAGGLSKLLASDS